MTVRAGAPVTPLQRARAELLPAAEAELRAFLGARGRASATRSPAALDAFYGMMRYALGWVDEQLRPATGAQGKRLRPLLCLLACDAAGGSWQTALPAAAALELLHNFTLVHDDIEDHDEVRHHWPTLWKLWGEPLAINVGDGMHVLAYLALRRLHASGVPPQRILEVVQLLHETSLIITEGQHLDLEFERRTSVEVDEYLDMIERKSAALLRCAAGLGARVAGAGEDTVAALEAYGRHLGLAFQTRDDLLGLWGREETTGKPWASDLRRGKKTLPVLHGLASARAADRELIAAVIGGRARDENSVQAAVAALERAGARARADDVVAEHSAAALTAIATLPPTEARGALEELVAELRSRER